MMVRLVPALLLISLGVAGCLSMRGDYDPFRTGSDRRLTVIVLNENYSTVTVTALSSGRRTLMGRAAGSAQSTFSIPWEGQGEVRFLLEVFGGGSHTTRTVYLSPGERVQIRVRDPLQQTILQS